MEEQKSENNEEQIVQDFCIEELELAEALQVTDEKLTCGNYNL